MLLRNWPLELLAKLTHKSASKVTAMCAGVYSALSYSTSNVRFPQAVDAFVAKRTQRIGCLREAMTS